MRNDRKAKKTWSMTLYATQRETEAIDQCNTYQLLGEIADLDVFGERVEVHMVEASTKLEIGDGQNLGIIGAW